MQTMSSMEVDKEIPTDYKKKYNTRFTAYLRIVNLQFELMKNKNLMLEDAFLAENILELEIQKYHFSRQIADFMRKPTFQASEVSQIEEQYELLIRGIATASLRE